MAGRWSWSRRPPSPAGPASLAPTTTPTNSTTTTEPARWTNTLDVVSLSGGGTALVLGEEPAVTAWLPQERLLVRWLWAEPGTPVESVVREAAAITAWEPGPRLRVPGPLLMFDSAFSGDEAGPYMTVVTVDLPPGSYETSTADVQPDECTCFRLHRFALVEPIEPRP
ncbi:Imm21 family immunity protein [Streptomyces sp. NBC_00829]|uniref:Imm21 family immunity protein n=1 Tax=Streptomyces sp. NBC_00829 TaxID=2903679 RepID=UPI003866E1A6|nr:immunity 21 family protein [Streptomyces sp. NBC_00829]